MKTKASPRAYKLFHDAALAFARMEHDGMRVDVDRLERTIRGTERKITRLRRELKEDKVFKTWRRLYGRDTNLGSEDQLRRVLYDELKLPVYAWTSGGKEGEHKKPSVDKNALALLDEPFVRKFVAVKELTNMKRTFLEGIRNELVDGFLHPMLNLHTARTYRSSSSKPNAHNFPKRNDFVAKLVRQNFVVRGPGWYKVEIDFKGIEVAVAACRTGDPSLIKYVTNPKSDMHGDTAQQIFLLKPDEVDRKTTRDASKNQFVFPEFYGSVYFQCAPAIWKAMTRRQFKVKGTDTLIIDHLAEHGITELGRCDPDYEPEEGTFEYLLQQVEKSFWEERFPVYARWKRENYARYREEGGFETLTGFYIHGHSGKGGFLSRNDVNNYDIQGSAFHCLLWSLIRVQNWLIRQKMKSKIVCQIHDSIIADVHESELQEYLNKVHEVITVDLPRHWDWIVVPMVVEVEVGDKNWYDMTEWKRNDKGYWAQAA